MPRKAIVLACLVLALAAIGRVVAEPPLDEKKLINKLMQKSVLVSVMNVAHPETFQEDNDPNTMQIVFMSDSTTKVHVSDDGEVVFTRADLSVNEQGSLTAEAFRRKAQRIMSGQAPPP